MSAWEPGWRLVLRINVAFAAAVGGLWLGHMLWEARSIEWWGIALLGLLLMLFGAAMALRGVIDTIQLIRRQRQIARFKRMGADPKGDALASEDGLRDRGMVR